MKKMKTFVGFVCCFFALNAHAVVDITVNRGTVEPAPIAIPAFVTKDASQQEVADNILEVVERDLAFSGFFSPLNEALFMQSAKDVLDNPRYNDWRIIQAQILLAGSMRPSGSGKIAFEGGLYDPFAEQKLMNIHFEFSRKDWRKAAHTISDQIYERVTGERGYFNTKMIYISDSGTFEAPNKRLAMMDQDGANVEYLTSEHTITLSPRISPDGKMITFLSYKDGHPKVYLMYLDTKRIEPLVDGQGMTFAPRFSPDNKKVIYSVSKHGNANIFEMDLRTKKIQKITSGYHIDTSPCYSPDGTKIVFESDRGGYQNLYVMDLKSGRTERISFGGGIHGTPVWSPKGNLIAFTRVKHGQFAIGVMRPNGDGKRIILEAFHVESPDWSPNGRRLVYFKEISSKSKKVKRKSNLYTIDLTGYDEQLIPTYHDASDPAWSL